MTTLNKKLLVEAVANELKITKKDATVAVDTVFSVITKTLSEGGKVDVSGFGKFEVSERAERTGINPSTKETVPREHMLMINGRLQTSKRTRKISI